MTVLSPKQEELCSQSRWDFSDLLAMFINCTLKRSPEESHTQGLADRSIEIMRRQGVTVDSVRAICSTTNWALRRGNGHLRRHRPLLVGPAPGRLEFDPFFSPEAAHQVLAGDADHYVKDAPVIAEFRHFLAAGS